MASLIPTLTLTSSDAFASQALSLSVTDNLSVAAPMADVSRMATNDNIGHGAGVILAESTNQYYVYVKHLGILASNFSSASHVSNDFVTLSDHDASGGLTIKLQPSEFAFFPMKQGDGSNGGGNDGGLKVTKGGADVVIEFAYFTRA